MGNLQCRVVDQAGSLGTLLPQIPDLSHDAVDAEKALPDAMILCYGHLDIADDSPSISCEKLFVPRADKKLPEPVAFCGRTLRCET